MIVQSNFDDILKVEISRFMTFFLYILHRIAEKKIVNNLNLKSFFCDKVSVIFTQNL